MIYGLLLVALAGTTQQRSIFVDAAGSDSNDGTAVGSAVATMDGVHAKLLAARSGGYTGDISVVVHGTVHQTTTTVFGPEANNTNFSGGGVISGGIDLTHWQETNYMGKRAFAVDFPSNKPLRMLYVRGKLSPSIRPTLPEVGNYRFADFLPTEGKKSWSLGGNTGMIFHDGDIPQLQNPSEIEIHTFNRWIATVARIKSIDYSNITVSFTKTTNRKLVEGNDNLPAEYRLENVKEAFGEKGRFYEDLTAHKLYYAPTDGDQLSGFYATAPAAESVVKFSQCTGVLFSDIKFRHCDADVPYAPDNHPQAAPGIPGEVIFADCHGCKLSNCEASATGTSGFEVASGSSDITIDHCRVNLVGASGIKIDSGTSSNFVTNCTVVRTGVTYPSAVGIWVGDSGHNDISHNRVEDTSYTAISVGWFTPAGMSKSQMNKVMYNDIRQIGSGDMSDIGGIYTLGSSKGTVVGHNRIGSITGKSYGAYGIYLDELSEGILVENNLVVGPFLAGRESADGAIFIHHGIDNTVRNNVFTGAIKGGQLCRMDDGAIKDGRLVMQLNVVVSGNGLAPLIMPKFNSTFLTMQNMLYWPGGQPLPPGDEGSGRFINPQLDPAGLPTNPEIFILGFQKIDPSEIGPKP